MITHEHGIATVACDDCGWFARAGGTKPSDLSILRAEAATHVHDQKHTIRLRTSQMITITPAGSQDDSQKGGPKDSPVSNQSERNYDA